MRHQLKIKKGVALVVVPVFVLVILLSAPFILEHAEHDCLGEYCATCAQISSAASLLKLIAAAGLTAAFAGVRWFLASPCSPAGVISSLGINLVFLKVRMNN